MAAVRAGARLPSPPTLRGNIQTANARPGMPRFRGLAARSPIEGGGEPLAPPVKHALEASLGVDLDSVRVHYDGHAHTVTETLGARAFAYGNHIFLGAGESKHDLALLAHETAHVVQQQSVAAIQLSSVARSDAYEREADRAASAVVRGDTYSVTERVSKPKVQRSLLGRLLDKLANWAYNIPGFRLLCVIIGKNPINMEDVDRSAANILRGLVELMPGGHLIEEALDKYGVFEKLGGWLEQQVARMVSIGHAIKADWDAFVDDLDWTDIRHPGKVFDDAVGVFTRAISRVARFAADVATDIIKFIKDAILMPLAKLAEGTRGWDLLIAVLGKNPITGETVPRTAETLIGGFMKLIGQEEVWENIKKANALARSWAWFQGAVTGLLGFVSRIPSLFIDALKSLTLEDILVLPKAFIKVGRVFVGFLGDFISWAGEQVWTLLQIIFEVVAPSVMPYLKKAAAAFRTILKNPGAFVGNLVKAAKQGFMQFASKFLEYLKAALIGWLTGTLEGANIYIPQAFTFMEIIKFVLSVLGLTWQNIRQKLVKVIGETAVKALEAGFDIVVTLVTKGPAAAWEKIQEGITNLKEMVIDGVMSFVKDRIVQAAITKLLSMLSPAGAFIQAIIAIYNTIMFFVERLRQIAQVVAAFIDSISAIANGVITAAANKVETTLGGLLTLVVSFLARLVGLGKVSDAVKDIINKVRDPIDKALDRVVEWIVTMAKKAGKFVVGKVEGAIQRVTDWWAVKKAFPAADGKTHTLLFRGEEKSAVLVIRSAETPFSDFVSRLQTANNPAKITAKNEAVRISGLIDAERKSAAPKPGTVDSLLDELKSHTSILLGPTIPDSMDPQFGAPSPANFGTSMLVKPLTNKNRVPGSDPTSAGNAAYAALNERKHSPGSDASYYIKGHLLNQQLGGKGTWANLTPLSRSGNAQHSSKAESIVKKTVDLPAIVEYSVVPSYSSRGDKASLLGAISSSSDAAEAKRVKSEIVKAEDSVPTSLTVDAYILDENLKRKDAVISQAISNPVDRNLNSYFLASMPKPVAVNLSEDGTDKIQTLPGIGAVLAERIVKVREDRKKQGFQRFGSYQQIADLVAGIGEGKLAALEQAGHVKLY